MLTGVLIIPMLVLPSACRSRPLIVPMGLGTILGSAAGAVLVGYVPAGGVRLLLGGVLIASALRVFAVDADGRR